MVVKVVYCIRTIVARLRLLMIFASHHFFCRSIVRLATSPPCAFIQSVALSLVLKLSFVSKSYICFFFFFKFSFEKPFDAFMIYLTKTKCWSLRSDRNLVWMKLSLVEINITSLFPYLLSLCISYYISYI